jgi:hypothetical protein
MEDTNEIETLRRLLREERHRREEEQHRREEAERLVAASRLQTLQQYLEDCHSLNVAIKVVTDPSFTTQGDTTNPTGRIFPRKIIPWNDFSTKQEEVWDSLSVGTLFSSVPAFPSQHQLEYVRSLLRPISSEIGLRDFERDVVENAVQKLIEKISLDPLLQSTLGLRGTVTFESHTNLGNADDYTTPEPTPLGEVGASAADASTTVPTSAALPLEAAPRTRRKARGKGNRADQFCIYQTVEGQNIPVLAIEYKAPHKLGVEELVTGLTSEIQPERDVINQDGQGFAFTSRALATAIVTQLFSYMVGKGIQYGYVCTGEAFVFLHIPDDDPANVYFSVCVPSLDVIEDDETRLHRTAAAQVFAFILQALRARPLSQLWHDKADRLETWAVEYDDILKRIPETDRKRKKPRATPYKAQRWKGFKRSPIRTRARCQQPDPQSAPREDDDSEDDPPSPTPRAGGKAASLTGRGSRGGRRANQRQDPRHVPKPTKEPSIQDRPFCTQKCLLGLAYGLLPQDKSCPNSHDHEQRERIGRLDFLSRVRDQLATDRGPDADCAPLYRSGARGSLFKVRLSAYGYTLVAKGVESLDRGHLQHENNVYDRLRAIQGKYIPVCLGSVDLLRPYYYDSGVFKHFLFLGWAGRPLFDSHSQISSAQLVQQVTTIFKAIHRLHILHRDAEPRNILCQDGTVMVIDFERAEFRGHQPRGLTAANGQARKGKRGVPQIQSKDDFERELESAVMKASRCME